MLDPAAVRICERLFEVLDWDALGDLYCDEGGAAFWADRRRPTLDCGARWAAALQRRLGDRRGRSLYVGAGVAELPVMLHESARPGRTVLAANLRAAECELLNRGLASVGVPESRLRIRAEDASRTAAEGPFDHLSLVSVLTDPESWPLTSAVTYGRLPPVLLDVAAFVAERRAIEALVDRLGGALAPRALVATTVDEVPWLYAWRDRVGAEIEADDETVATAIVGDPLGFLTVSSGCQH